MSAPRIRTWRALATLIRRSPWSWVGSLLLGIVFMLFIQVQALLI